MLFEIIAGADAGYYKEQEHEPGIDDVLEDIVILDIKVCDLAGHAHYSLPVIHVDNMINNDQNDRDPSQVVNV